MPQPCAGVHLWCKFLPFARSANRNSGFLPDQVVLAEDLLSSQRRLVAIKVMKRHCTQLGLEVGLFRNNSFGIHLQRQYGATWNAS